MVFLLILLGVCALWMFMFPGVYGLVLFVLLCSSGVFGLLLDGLVWLY